MSDVIYMPDGTACKFGWNVPEEIRYGAVQTWSDANPQIPRDQWQEHDDYAPFAKPIKYQQHNNCANASYAGLLEVAFRDTAPVLSSTFLYAYCNGGRDSGAMCRDIIEKGAEIGLAPESLVPESKIYLPRGGYSQEIMDEAAKYKPLDVYQCMTVEDIGSALTRRFLVYFGVCLGNANQFINGTGSDGKVPPYSGAATAGHAMYLRGITRRFGDLRFVMVNSWSNTWGNSGIGYMPLEYFWDQRGNYINLEAFAIRAVKHNDDLPDVKG